MVRYVLTLSSITETHPHSAYCAFVHGMVPKFMQIIESRLFVSTFRVSNSSIFYSYFNWLGPLL